MICVKAVQTSKKVPMFTWNQDIVKREIERREGRDNEIGGFSRREGGGCLASHGEFYILDY